MDFTNVTDLQLDNLARACDPATFGLAQKDVLDESYRKAGKMDANRFATHFSPTDQGILEIVSDFLLRGRVPEKSIRLELYKLNIYGTCFSPRFCFSRLPNKIDRSWRVLQGARRYSSQ